MTISHRLSTHFLVCIALLALAAGHVMAQEPAPWRPYTDGVTPNGPVSAMARYGDRLFLGGRFTGFAGFNAGSAALDPATGRARPGFPLFRNLSAVVEDGAGGWYAVNGTLTGSTGRREPMKLLHLSADGAVLDARELDLQPADLTVLEPVSVRTMVLRGEALYLGGAFARVNGEPRGNLAAINLSTGELLPWNPVADNAVTSLVAADGYILALGYFRKIAGDSTAELVRLSAETGALLPWANGVPRELLVPLPGVIAVSKGKLYTANGAMDLETGALAAWKPRPEKDVWEPIYYARIHDLLIDSGRIYVVGEFTLLDGQRRHGVAAYDEATGRLLDWAPNARFDTNRVFRYFHARIYQIEKAGGKLWLAGTFIDFNGQPANGLVGIDPTTGVNGILPALLPSVPEIFNNISLLGGSDESLIVTATVASIGLPAESQEALAEISVSSGRLVGWRPRIVSIALDTLTESSTAFFMSLPYVSTLAIGGTWLYAGGLFDSVDGAHRSRLAAFDLETNSLLPWSPEVIGRRVDLLAISGRTLYVAGDFWTIDGVARRSLAAIDATTGEVLPWNPQANRPVTSMIVRNGRVYLGGTFDTVAGVRRPGFAVVDSATGAVIDEGPVLPRHSLVSSMAIDGDRIYLSGAGTVEPGSSHIPPYGLVGYSLSSGAVEWLPRLAGTVPMIEAQTLVVDNNRVYAAGIFHLAPTTTALFVFDAVTGRSILPEPLRGSVPLNSRQAVVRSLLVSDDTIYIGGAYRYLASGHYMPYLTRLDPVGTSSAPLPMPAPENRLALYPNPATSSIRIDCSALSLPARVMVVDMLGNNVLQTEATAARTELSVEGLAPGSYIVSVAEKRARLVIVR